MNSVDLDSSDKIKAMIEADPKVTMESLLELDAVPRDLNLTAMTAVRVFEQKRRDAVAAAAKATATATATAATTAATSSASVASTAAPTPPTKAKKLGALANVDSASFTKQLDLKPLQMWQHQVTASFDEIAAAVRAEKEKGEGEGDDGTNSSSTNSGSTIGGKDSNIAMVPVTWAQIARDDVDNDKLLQLFKLGQIDTAKLFNAGNTAFRRVHEMVLSLCY